MTDVDKKLQDIAQSDWQLFLAIIGKDAEITAKARILHKEGKSYRQISIKLSTTESVARYACTKENKAC